MNALELFNISAEMRNVLAFIEEGGGELTPELEQALTITEERFDTIAVDFGRLSLYLDAHAKAAKAEVERVQAIQKKAENGKKRLQEAIVAAMKACGKDKVETPTLRIFLRHTTATEVDDLEALPAEFKVTKVEEVADKTAIKKAIQAGEAVPGAHLVENVSLQIK